MVANTGCVEFQDLILDEMMESVKIGNCLYISCHFQFVTSCNGGDSEKPNSRIECRKKRSKRPAWVFFLGSMMGVFLYKDRT